MSDDKKNLIIESAIKVLSTENYQSMKTAMIAKEAGVAQGTIYLYFKSKQEIFTEVILSIGDKMAAIYFENVSELNRISENLTIIVKNFYNRRKETEGIYRIIYKAFSELEDRNIKRILDEIFERIISSISTIINWGIKKKEIELKEIDVRFASTLIFGFTETVWKRDILSDSKLTEEDLQSSLSKIMSLITV